MLKYTASTQNYCEDADYDVDEVSKDYERMKECYSYGEDVGEEEFNASYASLVTILDYKQVPTIKKESILGRCL